MTAAAPDAEPLHDDAHRAQVLGSSTAFDGAIWSVRTDRVRLDGGDEVTRDAVHHPGAVGIIALDDDERVLLVRQYRHPAGAMLWEPPAGLLDIDGEDPADAAARELYEEAGYHAATWAVLVDAFTTPGMSSESIRIFLARDLSEVAEADRYIGEGEERDMPQRWVPLPDAVDAALSGRLHNPMAVMGILAVSTAAATGFSALRTPTSSWLRGGYAPHR